MNYLFGSGTARGGTGILVQTLSAHSQVEYALDPALEIFKSFRNAVLRNKFSKHKIEKYNFLSPLSDYYFSDFQNEILELILSSDLNISIDQIEQKQLIENMKPRTALDNIDLIDHMTDNLQSNSYQEFVLSMAKLIANIRGSKITRYTGFHENWAIEMFPALARSFPNAKFIVVLRDPRAIQASHLAVTENLRTSMLSFARGMRKLFNLTYYYLNCEIFNNRLVVVTYEELIRNPSHVAKRMCQFLELDYEPGMIDINKHLSPGSNKLRNGVSSFEKKATGYNENRIDRWKQYLIEDNLSLTEMIVDPDMRFFGYMPMTDTMTSLDWNGSLNALNYDNQNSSFLWTTDSDQVEKEFGLELVRKHILQNSIGGKETVKRCFLKQKIFSLVKDFPLYDDSFLAKGGMWFA